MALTTVQFYLRDKLDCGPCQDVILTVDDGTTSQELTATILYETANNPQAGYWLYTVQYEEDDLVVATLNQCTIKGVRCKSCCDEIILGAKWAVQDVIENSEPDFDAMVADATGGDTDKLLLAEKDLYIKASVNATSNDPIFVHLYLQIADDDLGTNTKKIDIDRQSVADTTVVLSKVGGIVPKGKYWRVAADLSSPADAAWLKGTFHIAIMESF